MADVRSISVKITLRQEVLLQSEWQNVTPFTVLFRLKTKRVVGVGKNHRRGTNLTAAMWLLSKWSNIP